MSSIIQWLCTSSFERDMVYIALLLILILVIQYTVLDIYVKRRKKKCDYVDVTRCVNCMYCHEMTYPESGREALYCNYAMSDEVPSDGFCYLGRVKDNEEMQ